MDIRILGPVEVSVEGRAVAIGAGKPRALLAMLALRAGSSVSADRLIDGLWGERPPATAAKLVQLHVSHLRKALAAGGDGASIVTRGHGYELRVGPDDIDARRFERLVADGLPREGLALWRGPALDDVSGEPFAAPEIRRLEELRLAALEQAIEQDLVAGRHREVVGELEVLVGEEPLRETLHAQRMLALYRCGRQADALAAYRRARDALVGEIGVEPGPDLRRLHEAILRQDPSLEAPAVDPLVLPPELDTRTPMVGRAEELGQLLRRWRQARDGTGGLVHLAGPRGIGKTRLAAELAAAVQRDGGAVSYVSGAPERAVAAASAVRRPSLLILDDVDGSGDGHALAALAEELATQPLLVVAITDAGDRAAAAGLRLRPIDSDAVRDVARFHAAALGAVAIPVADLVAASGGIPREVHRAASEWARAVAARRVGDAAGRIAAERPGLRAAEDDLAGSLVEQQAARERVAFETSVGDVVVVCPFKGLASFELEDADLFFGRERLVAEIVARLTGAPLTGIVGASGSGKSSVLKGGVLAALAAGILPGSERWALALLRPGEHPLQALAQATDGASPGRLVIAVDQFEEAFIACRDEDERAAFVDALVASTRDPRRRAIVLVAIRADFYGRCAAYPELARLIGANHVLVGPMRRDELRRAIDGPARHAGLRVAADLGDALITDVDGEPGALPLLSTSLVELWQHRDGRALDLATYERFGGVRGAVARLAERAYARLDPDRQALARRILLRLADDTQGDVVVRRRIAPDELEGERDEISDVLAVLADERLVTIGEDGVEVAHEALLREWPRLRTWLEEDAEGRRLHQHLILAARDWQAAGREPGELYRGARLAAALDWLRDHEREPNAFEREFLDQSRTQAEHEGERQRQANRRLRSLLAGLAAVLALAIVAGVVAVSQRGEARDAAVSADAQRLGADARTRERLDHALLLARAGVELDDSAATRGNLLAVLAREPLALGVLPEDGRQLWSAAASRDGRLAAVGGAAGAVSVVDAVTRRPVGRPYRLRRGVVQDLRFSPDSRTLAVAGIDLGVPGASGMVDLIDTRTLARRVRIVPPRFPKPVQSVALHVRFTPGGRDVIVEQVPENGAVDGPPSLLRRFDGATGAPEGPALRVGEHTAIGMAPTRDGQRLFLTSERDDATYQVDAESLRVVRRWPAGGFVGAVDADGSRFALGSQEGGVRVLDLRSGRVRRFAGGHEASVQSVRFAPDGRTLVTGGADGQVLVWDVAGGAVRDALSGHAQGQTWGLDVSADGSTAYSAGEDNRAFAWDLTGDRSLARTFTAARPFVADYDGGFPRGLALSPDGRTLALGHSDGTVDLVDSRSLRRQRSLRALRGYVGAIAFSGDGRRLAIAGQHGQVALWDARTLRPVAEVRGLRTLIQAVAFSPDDRHLAIAELGVPPRMGDPSLSYRDASVRVWDLEREAFTAVRFATSSASIVFSPDGTVLAAGNLQGNRSEIRNARTGRLVARVRTPNDTRSVAFSGDGRLLATGHFDGTAQLWSTASWTRIGRPLEGHDGKRFLWMEFSPNGAVLATTGLDGTATLFDVATQNPLGTPLTVEANSFLAADLSPDGSHLFVVSDRRRAMRWNLDPEAWKRHACRVAGRELTAREWEDALPGRPYRTLCRSG